MNKLTFWLSLLLFCFSGLTNAKTTMKNWENGEAQTTSSTTEGNLEITTTLIANVNNSSSIGTGVRQRYNSYPHIYFFLVQDSYDGFYQAVDSCAPLYFNSDNNHLSKIENWKVGDTIVEMYVECLYIDTLLSWGISATPNTDAGERYVYSLFKKSSQPIAVTDSSRFNEKLSATGFVKTWKAAETAIMSKANSGDASNQFYLGLLNYKVLENNKAAASWYLKAAQQGHLNGQEWMGHFYSQGLGVPVNKDKSEYWLRKAAEQGSQYAKDELSKSNQ